MIMKRIGITLLACFSVIMVSHAQPQLLDKIVSVVGDNVVLKSEVDIQVAQYKTQGATGPNLDCGILDQLITQKILVAKAREDSIQIGEEEVSAELDRRMRYFVSLVGTKEKFEEFYGKTVDEYKEDFRTDVEKQLMAQRVQSSIIGDVPISPKEVRAFFSKIPKDSLPYYNAEVEFHQVVIYPKVGKEQEKVARDRLIRIKKDIVENGKEFGFMAELYSDDEGSARNGGSLGCFGRGEMVGPFEAQMNVLRGSDAWKMSPTTNAYGKDLSPISLHQRREFPILNRTRH